MINGSALRYVEEKIIYSDTYDRATKMKVDKERDEVTVYRKGWEQLRSKIALNPHIRNSRNHLQSKTFVEHVKNTVVLIAQKFKTKENNC